MPSHWPSLEPVRAWIPNLCAVVGLAGVWSCGHACHWTLPTGDVPVAVDPQEDEREDATEAEGAIIRLASVEAVRKSGLVVGTATVAPLTEYVTAHGVVEYNRHRTAEIASPVAGTIWRVEKKIGESVRQGDVLALVSSVDVGTAKTEFLHTALDLAHKRRQWERLRRAGGAVAERQVRNADIDVREARIRLLHAQQTLGNLGLPVAYDPDASSTDEELVARMHFLGLPESLAASLEPQLVSSNLLPLKAPFDGVVIGRACVTGEVVLPARPQFVIADLSRMWIELDVSEEDAPKLALGQPVRFAAHGLPRELECRLSWIGTDIDEKTRTVQVRAEVDNPPAGPEGSAAHGHRLLKANVFGIGRIGVRHVTEALRLPREAVQWDGRSHVVFCAIGEGRAFEPVPVQVGTTDGNQVEILSGITPADAVVLAGSHLLKLELVRRGVTNEDYRTRRDRPAPQMDAHSIAASHPESAPNTPDDHGG